MSSQRQLSDYGPDPEPVADHQVDAADWSPGVDVERRECQNCGRHVTRSYRRKFGDENEIAWHCPRCITQAEAQRAAGDPDYECRVAEEGRCGGRRTRGVNKR